MSTDTAVPAGIANGTWTIDPGHSSVEFQVKHMGLATVKGFFSEFEGKIEVAEDGTISASGSVDAASLNTRSNQRDEHLRSADFFDVENHEKLSFQSTKVEQLNEETYRITGDLTIRGTTREVVFEGVTQGVGQIERSDFGLNWNQALESGGVLVGKKVKILLDLSTVKA